MNKMNNILEKFWLAVATIATVFTIVIGFIDNFKGIRVFLILCGLAWGLYFIRRGLRKRLEKIDNTSSKKNK
tara:strand:+ start:422 stop:637 length:216 start_codon:yes stop_codon:yes gene_type:complete